MIFDALPIKGAYKITPSKLGDDRGAFARVYCEKLFGEQGLNTHWVQMNTSINVTKGQLRGMHFQRPPFAEVKLVRCVQGKIFDAIVDLRVGSATYGQSCAVTLDSQKLEMIYIPQGCAHGFQTLSDSAILHYSHSEEYAPDYEGGIFHNDPTLSIEWPLPIVNVSDRDKSFPKLSSIKPVKL